MVLQLLFTLAVAAWGASEIAMALFMRSKRDASTRGDRGSLPLLVVVIAGSAALGLTANFGPAAEITGSESLRWGVALGLVLSGIIFRWNAIITLGSYFTTNVAIQTDHRLVQEGVYRILRHPSYTGTLLIMAGVAFATNNWINAALVLVPCAAAIIYRIGIEEEVLLGAFGQDYRRFCQSTKRLIPGLY
jgi:protein-S-isoprenylcysteine O-methyltransferase Ste14